MPKKYFTPSTSDLYQAPRVEGNVWDHKVQSKLSELSKSLGFTRLSSINAMIDVRQQTKDITQEEALEVFNMARLTVVETVQLN